MAHPPDSLHGIEKTASKNRRRRFLVFGIIVLAAAVLAFWQWQAQQSVEPETASDLSPKVVDAEPAVSEGTVAEPEPTADTAGSMDPEPETVVTEEASGEEQARMEKDFIDVFKAEALETLPLLTLHTADPLDPDRPGPKPGEIWIRIRPSRSGETRDIMAQVADLYKTIVRQEETVTVMLWVGGQPMARFED